MSWLFEPERMETIWKELEKKLADFNGLIPMSG